MDPITIAIVAAISAGVTAAGPNVVAKAINDGYEALKKLIAKKYDQKHPSVTQSLAAVENNQESSAASAYQQVLSAEIKKAGADKDGELLKAANDLLSKLEEIPEAKVVITQYSTGNHNVLIGDGNYYGSKKE